MTLDTDFQQYFYRLIGNKIASFRKERKLSQAAFATRLRLSRSSVVNIELGRQHTPPHVLWQIAQSFSLSIDEIFPTPQELEDFMTNPTFHEAIQDINKQHQKSISDFINNIT